MTGRLSASQLACERGGRRIFSRLSFTMAPGEFLELRGPNGSGKSSLLRLLAGFDAPAEGSLYLEGADRIADHAAYAGHQDALKPALTAAENLAFWRDFFGGGDVARALAAFGLTALADDPAALLSQGQKRRLALSRLALADRPVWLLDEPDAGLDATSLAQLGTLIAGQLAKGGLVIAATHSGLGIAPTAVLTLERRA